MRRRTVQSNLIALRGRCFTPHFPGTETAFRVFSEALPLVGYNERAAHLLSVGGFPGTPWLNTLKCQLAALMAPGFEDILFVDTHVVKLRDVDKAEPMGMANALMPSGTLWTRLGLVKRAFQTTKDSVEEVSSQTLNQIPLLGDSLWVRATECFDWRHLSNALGRRMKHHDFEVKEVGFEDEPGGLETPDFDDFYFAIVRVFLHQLVIVTFNDGGKKAFDLVSSAEVQLAAVVTGLIDWEKVADANDGFPLVGFYTRAVRRSGRTVIMDWNWIPSIRILECAAGLGRGGLEKLARRTGPRPNADEVIEPSSDEPVTSD
jgi:hypothetical protein